jgi:hypothetical protein
LLFYVRMKIKIYVLLNLSRLSSSKQVNKCVLLTTIKIMVIVYIYFLYNETNIKITVYVRRSSGNGLRTVSSEWMNDERVNECVFCSSSERGLKRLLPQWCYQDNNETDKSGDYGLQLILEKKQENWRACFVKSMVNIIHIYIHIHKSAPFVKLDNIYCIWI